MTLQLTTFTAQVKDWANRQDWSTPLVQSLVTMAEQRMNADLRVQQMLATVENLVTCRCSTLPTDWLEAYLIFIQNSRGANGWLPIRYKSNDEFFNLRDGPAYGYYTIVGSTINFGGTPSALDGIAYKMVYYQEVPPLNDNTDSWVYTKYPNLYLWSALSPAALHAVGEEPQANNFSTLADGLISKLNMAWLRAKASGSRVTKTRTRSFG